MPIMKNKGHRTFEPFHLYAVFYHKGTANPSSLFALFDIPDAKHYNEMEGTIQYTYSQQD